MQRVYNANRSWESSGIMSSNLQLGFLFCNLKCGLPGAFRLKWYLIELGSSSGKGLGFCCCCLLQLSSLLEKTRSHFLYVHLVIFKNLVETISNNSQTHKVYMSTLNCVEGSPSILIIKNLRDLYEDKVDRINQRKTNS